MSVQNSDYSTHKHLKWVACMGDFALLRDALSEKKLKEKRTFWTCVGLIDSLFRGWGQVVLANNPISGVLIIAVLASTYPGVLVSGVATSVLGLLISMLIRGSPEHVENGLTVYNPLLIGAVTYSLFPKEYGVIDSFVILVTLLATIISVYLTRSFTSARFPCITWPFNIMQIIVLLIFMMEAKNHSKIDMAIYNMTDVIQDKIMTEANADWGMIFRGVVTSSSQIFAVDSVAVGSVIYLAILIYSPVTAAFSFIGAFIGTLSALQLGVPYEEIYTGLWGYNSLLSSCSLGGLFIVLNLQSVPLAFVASVFTVFLQYIFQHFFLQIHIPVLTVPFVVTVWLFLGLRDSEDNAFPKPDNVTFPEEIRYNLYCANQKNLKNTNSIMVDENYEQVSISILPDINQFKSN